MGNDRAPKGVSQSDRDRCKERSESGAVMKETATSTQSSSPTATTATAASTVATNAPTPSTPPPTATTSTASTTSTAAPTTTPAAPSTTLARPPPVAVAVVAASLWGRGVVETLTNKVAPRRPPSHSTGIQ
ncbi:unnamed protein product [Closterium sp. NIES-53]